MMRVLAREDQTFVYAHFIRRLNFLNVAADLTDSLFSRLAHCVRLERLTLMNCTALSDEGLTRVLPRCPNLVALDLTSVAEVTDRTIIAVAKSAKRLQGINLTGCKKLTDASVMALAQNCPSLRRVKLSNVELITDQSVSALARSCPLLLEIDLNNCKRITDVGVRDLWTHSTQMREMRFSYCVELTDAAFPAPAKRDALVSGINPFASSSHGLPDFPPLRISQPFEQLRMLDLTACGQITDDAIEGIVSAAPKIRNLVLAKCTQLTDNAVESICKLGKGLHYLHLGHAVSITDRSINSLVRSCTRLRYIDLANCQQLTDMSVFELSTLPKLRRIGLVRVSNLTDQAIQALGERHATLERIHLSYCDQISVMAIHFLLQKLPKLTHLSLTGIPAFRRAELQQFCRSPPSEFNSQQRAAFCVYSGHGVVELREFLADLFATITNELATSNDTDYEDEFEEAEAQTVGNAVDAVLDEDEDEDESASEVFVAPRNHDLLATPRAHERPFQEDHSSHRTHYVPSREHMMAREHRRHPAPRAQPRAQAAAQPMWLDTSAGPSRPRRGFGQQPLIEQSTSPTPSEAASNRSAGTNHSTGTAFFRTYADGNTPARNGVMTPDLVYAEIGHGRGGGPGPSTILVQNHARRDAGPVVESSYASSSSSPSGRGMMPSTQPSIGMAVFDSRHTAFHPRDPPPRYDYAVSRSPILHDASNQYMRTHGVPDAVPGFSVLRETSPRSLSPTPSTRELQESVHSALAGTNGHVPMEVDGRGRSVKRTLRNTFAAAETFFGGRAPPGGSSGDGANGHAGGRDVDAHGH
ncbi:RNI-like protein [Trametes coccinea BRFM310]|uniref:RNI-like protein n=1 Tax=Trametes coccinea (strain BRFM310) TaxID=1353009 RepID=A0A1Y2ICZ7_TRAC3|nr:RNI-like protein [Trametes coccinea BRFM310]